MGRRRQPRVHRAGGAYGDLRRCDVPLAVGVAPPGTKISVAGRPRKRTAHAHAHAHEHQQRARARGTWHVARDNVHVARDDVLVLVRGKRARARARSRPFPLRTARSISGTAAPETTGEDGISSTYAPIFMAGDRRRATFRF